jgi:hypothetical protein
MNHKGTFSFLAFSLKHNHRLIKIELFVRQTEKQKKSFRSPKHKRMPRITKGENSGNGYKEKSKAIHGHKA